MAAARAIRIRKNPKRLPAPGARTFPFGRSFKKTVYTAGLLRKDLQFTAETPGSTALRFAWVIPILFLLWIDQYGLRCWFMQDDFAWLGLLRSVPESMSLQHALFSPAAQGTIRPL